MLLATSACKKDHPVSQPTVVYYDTVITLQNQGPAVRLSFTPNTFIDLWMNTNIQEDRCPNCLTLGPTQCPYRGLAEATFIVKKQDGDSAILGGVFKSCYAENDTTQGKANSASKFSPFNTYNIWCMALSPYPTDTISLHYSLKLLVQYPSKQ